MNIVLRVDNQRIVRIDKNTIIADSKNYLYAKFVFVTNEWQGTKTAIFTHKGIPYKMILDDNNECEVPWEVIKAGSFSVSVFCGDLITTNSANVLVGKSGYAEAGEPKEPTPDVYAQIIEMLDALQLGSVSEATLKAAIAEYMAANPIETLSEEDVNAIITKYMNDNPIDAGVSEEQVTTLVDDYLTAKEKLNNKFILMEELNNSYSDIKEKLLSFAYGFILADGTDTTALCVDMENGVVCSIDSVDLYGGTNGDKYYTDYIYCKDGAYKIVRQVNTTDYVQLGYTEETDIDVSDDLIDTILLPLKLHEVLSLINGTNTSLHTLSYADCGAYLDGIHDDRPYMECCHRIANKYKLKVEQHTGTIYSANSGWIDVKTDMSLKGSTMLIDNYNRQGIYWLSSTEWDAPEDIDYTELTANCSYCTAINDGFPNYTLLKLTNPADCIRIDDGTETSTSREELCLMTYKGNIVYPPIQDATENTTYNVYVYPEQKTVIEGCTLNIAVSFSGSPIYFMRIEKSNVEVRDWYILPKGSTTKNTRYRGSVFVVRNAFSVTFDNIIGYNIAGQPTDSIPNGMSGYVFKFESSLCITIKNCNVTGYWGCMGMNGVKNVVVDNSTLNRIDVHDYFKGLKISNCTILNCGVQVGYGHGQIAITNCTLYTNRPYFVELRTDYGNMFDGIIALTNAHVIYTGNDVFNIVDNSSNFVPDALTLNENTTLQKPSISISGVSLEPVCNYSISNFVVDEDITYEDNSTIVRVTE